MLKTTVEPGQYAVYDYRKWEYDDAGYSHEPIVFISAIEHGVATIHLNNQLQLNCSVDCLRPFILVMRDSESK